ncbi:hypothetical protein LTR62_008325 [Meristemomyces frigidus]|uniref:Uncharacterized protein n=1 Tax=Meristemomyces frigidus TaxID=1508187 RepID=A0AAN7T9U1_9PEZI|nr:hypothetical protein LTR62_008325 [Meristemomyces frigidus]
MLNTRALNDLLSSNSDERLCKCWYLMSPNGTILASTQPSDTKHQRKQAAVAALYWQEHLDGGEIDHVSIQQQGGLGRDLHTLSVESATSNLIICRLQHELLLVLEGGVPPRKRTFAPRVTAQDPSGELLLPASTAESSLSGSLSSFADTNRIASSSSVLALHRKKLDAMAAAILADLERTGFKMPRDGEEGLF